MTATPAHTLHPASSTSVTLEAMRQQGAANFDAVGWHYIEVLSAKRQTHPSATQHLLQNKLDKALHDLQTRMAAASMQMPAPEPMPAPPSSPLTQLLHALGEPAAQGSRAENPQVTQFRKTLSQLSVQKQVTQAMAQAPHNAGPINSHMLVLRSLALMRQHAPDYLNRFVTYVDTLLCLEAAGKAKPLIKKPRASTKPHV